MGETSLTKETYNAFQVRREYARATLGWGMSKDGDHADDHARACSLLLESEFLPDREQVSLIGMICGTGCVSIHLMPEVDESLARAELHHFASRFYYFDPDERSQVWAQITETVASFPALAWRHGCLKAGLQVPRDVLAPLEDRVDLAAAIIQWSILPPQQAAVEIRRYAWQASENSRTMGQCWNDWYELQLKARPVALLMLPGIGISQRLNWISEAKLAKNVEHLVDEPVELTGSSNHRLSMVSSGTAMLIILTMLMLPVGVLVWPGIKIIIEQLIVSSQSQQTTPQLVPVMSASANPTVPSPLKFQGEVPATAAERDIVRGKIIMGLLLSVETRRLYSDNSDDFVPASISDHISDEIAELKELSMLHAIADTVDPRSDQTVHDVGLILPRTISNFRCRGFARLDARGHIHNAIWLSGISVVDAEMAREITDLLKITKTQDPPDEAARLALQTELEQLTEIKVLVLTPEQFLATFDPPKPLDLERAAADQFPGVSPQPDAPTQQD